MKTANLHMRVTPELKAKLATEAASLHVDVSALVSMVLSEWLERRHADPTATATPQIAATNADR